LGPELGLRRSRRDNRRLSLLLNASGRQYRDSQYEQNNPFHQY